MQTRDLAEFFGMPVLVQFREAIALVTPGETKKYMAVNAVGEPSVRPTREGFSVGSGEAQEPLVEREKVGDEMLPRFTLTLSCSLLPSPSERIYAVYQSGGSVVRVAVHPNDILAVNAIGKSEDGQGSLIARP